eukprot:CAMPEP_0194574832 /NCGR_PEP_ID=MMETSP0292-20121207/10536_1 /TAXON_ID=39354 /ORGANISM="Heterosigma akashiwo, Strain CCMP2393" /LENGTH=335 /DNA_ID=CAMNT_0039426453 /DNA_START=104 /DNA_END=1108 /DNA_ORIENTATION=+
MGSFLLITLQILDIIFVNQHLYHRGGKSFTTGEFFGFDSVYNIPAHQSYDPPLDTSNYLVYVDGQFYNDGSGVSFGNQSVESIAIEAYEQHGVEFAKHLDGEFSLVLVDSWRRKLVVATDAVGLKPLFLAEDGPGRWGVSSSPTALERMGLAAAARFPGNAFQVWNLTADGPQVPALWYQAPTHEWRAAPVKLCYAEWRAALARAARSRAAATGPAVVVPGLPGTEGAAALRLLLGLPAANDREKEPAAAVAGEEEGGAAAARCAAALAPRRLEPWRPELFGDPAALAAARRDCPRILESAEEGGAFLSELGWAELHLSGDPGSSAAAAAAAAAA